jgi:hypothetical protein
VDDRRLQVAEAEANLERSKFEQKRIDDLRDRKTVAAADWEDEAPFLLEGLQPA